MFSHERSHLLIYDFTLYTVVDRLAKICGLIDQSGQPVEYYKNFHIISHKRQYTTHLKAHVHPNGFAQLCFCFETILLSNAVF